MIGLLFEFFLGLFEATYTSGHDYFLDDFNQTIITFNGFSMDFSYYLSYLCSLISLIIILVLCCLFVVKIIKLVGNLVR